MRASPGLVRSGLATIFPATEKHRQDKERENGHRDARAAILGGQRRRLR